MKKIASIILTLCLLITLNACGQKNVQNITVPVQNLPVVTAPAETLNQNTESVEPSDNHEPTAEPTSQIPERKDNSEEFDYYTIPEYSGKGYYVVNNNEPFFADEEKTQTDAFENYSNLDSLGRCGVAFANICKDLMPTEKRGDISSVHPSGWDYNGKSNNNQYSGLAGGGNTFYNRCHLIGFQLAGENANKLNLVTGTTYMNHNDGMLQFENMIDDWVDEEDGHCLLRVTPIFIGNEVVCRGVLMEAWSVEDDGDSICFNVFCYNVQPGYEINYMTGENWPVGQTNISNTEKTQIFVLNINSYKFHIKDCPSAAKISDKNREVRETTRDALINSGYSPCGICNP